jgi:hypothetical protein
MCYRTLGKSYNIHTFTVLFPNKIQPGWVLYLTLSAKQ